MLSLLDGQNSEVDLVGLVSTERVFGMSPCPPAIVATNSMELGVDEHHIKLAAR